MPTVELPMSELAPLLELQLRSGGKASLAVTGSSMEPMLRDRRDLVWLTVLDHPPQRGDILLYRQPSGRYILHRVVQSGARAECLCCGDNDWKTEPVRREDVIGVVYAFCRKGKTMDVHDGAYRAYVRTWTALFPWRRPILLLRRSLAKLHRTRRGSESAR
jgi:hypothetical protein